MHRVDCNTLFHAWLLGLPYKNACLLAGYRRLNTGKAAKCNAHSEQALLSKLTSFCVNHSQESMYQTSPGAILMFIWSIIAQADAIWVIVCNQLKITSAEVIHPCTCKFLQQGQASIGDVESDYINDFQQLAGAPEPPCSRIQDPPYTWRWRGEVESELKSKLISDFPSHK